MNIEQYERWKDFAFRMVAVAIGGARWQRQLRSHLEELFARFECENWGIHYRTIADWDTHEPIPGDDGTFGFARSHHQPIIGDFVDEYCFDNGLVKEKEDRHGNCEQVDSRTAIALRCCVRAGLDIAVAPSAGVMGFTAGDIRKMYPEGVPEWVKGEPTWETQPLTGVVPGVGFTLGEPHSPKSFDELPDDAEICI